MHTRMQGKEYGSLQLHGLVNRQSVLVGIWQVSHCFEAIDLVGLDDTM
jgi:hypothetical protein